MKQNKKRKPQKADAQAKKPRHLYRIVLVLLAVILAAVNLLAFSQKFCDRFTDRMYPKIAEGLGRLTAPLPFALGEILLYLGIALLAAGGIIAVLLIFLRKKEPYRRFTKGYCKALLMTLCCVGLALTFCRRIPARGSVLGQGDAESRDRFAYQELHILLNYLADGANAAAGQIPVAEDGTITYPTPEQYRADIEASLHTLAHDFPRLGGFCPPVKDALCPQLLQKLERGAMPLPCTMEIIHDNSGELTPMTQPLADAAALCQHLGYYDREQAEFLAMLALAKSDNQFLRLIGFRKMYREIEFHYDSARRAYVKAVCEEQGIERPTHEYAEIKDLPLEEFNAVLEKEAAFDSEIAGPKPELIHRCNQLVTAADLNSHKIYISPDDPEYQTPEIDNSISKAADFNWLTEDTNLLERTYTNAELYILQYFDGKLY